MVGRENGENRHLFFFFVSIKKEVKKITAVMAITWYKQELPVRQSES